MLQKETILPVTLELIKLLQDKEYLKGFNLVGGTAFALYLKHRRSDDIDLFSNFDFNVSELIELIQQDFHLKLFHTAANTIKGSIEGTKVDFIAHRYPWLKEAEEIEGIRLASLPDLIAMKINAISTSGQRSKDFIDIYYVIEERKYDISEMVNFFRDKYSQEGDMHIIKSLIYFEDIDLSDWPVLVKNPELNWEEVKKRIKKEVLLYMKNEWRRGKR